MIADESVLQTMRFIRLSERLKTELRHSWLSSGRQESVAEHSWHMALLVLLTHKHLDVPVDIEKCLKMALIHDLVEAEAGDVPVMEQGPRREQKAAREQAAIDHISEMLPGELGQELYDVWMEFEERKTNEARFVGALDHLEVQIQHNLADLSTWEDIEYELVYTKMDKHVTHDTFLTTWCAAIKTEAEEKWREAGIDASEVKRAAKYP